MKTLLLVLLTFALIGPASAQPAQKVKPASTPVATERRSQLLAQTQQRIGQIDSVLKTVKWEAPVDSGARLSAPEKKLEAESNAWLAGLRTRLQNLRKDMQSATTLSGEEAVQKMTQMNMQFVALQEATQMENRKFQTLSNASKARHDIALNAIRNMK